MEKVFTDCVYPHPEDGCVTCRPVQKLGAVLTAANRAALQPRVVIKQRPVVSKGREKR